MTSEKLAMESCKEETVKVRGRKVRLFRGGEGPPLLFLHDTFCPSWLPIHQILAEHYEVFVPLHPGCAGSEDGFAQFEEMEDVIFHYLDVCETLHLDHPVVVGASFGGWIAAEWAIRYSGTLKGLVLIDALGLRVPEAPAPDILSLDPAASRQVIFADPSSALALEVIPETPKARRNRECSLGPADPGALRLAVSRQPEVTAISLSNKSADLDSLG